MNAIPNKLSKKFKRIHINKEYDEFSFWKLKLEIDWISNSLSRNPIELQYIGK